VSPALVVQMKNCLYIMTYGSTPYIGMNLQKMVATLKVYE